MKKARRILAVVGLALIALMYILTIVFALMKSPQAKGFLMAAIACTIIVPVIIYMFQLMAKNLKDTGRRLSEDFQSAPPNESDEKTDD